MSRILICGDSNSLGEWGTVIPGPAVANNDNPMSYLNLLQQRRIFKRTRKNPS